MAKVRSPQYPSIGLKEAIGKVRDVYNQDHQNAIPREVIACHMGYGSLNGKSLSILSALRKYGLFEGRGRSIRVSDLAVRIIAHEPGNSERFEAIKEAAGRPKLFAELDTRFRDGKASDPAIRSYLLAQKYIPSAADTVIRSYRETKRFVSAESSGYDPATETDLIEETMATARTQVLGSAVERDIAFPFTAVLSCDDYRVSLTSGCIEVEAKLTSKAALRKLIRSLQLNEQTLSDDTEAQIGDSVDNGNLDKLSE
jgi:hypothetical protein